MPPAVNPLAPHELPMFISGPDGADVLMNVAGAILLLSVLIAGNLFLRLHTMPERMAHRGKKVQFEIVAVLGVLALFTHVQLFWVAGLLLAMIDLPEFGVPLARMATSLEKLAGRSKRPETDYEEA